MAALGTKQDSVLPQMLPAFWLDGLAQSRVGWGGAEGGTEALDLPPRLSSPPHTLSGSSLKVKGPGCGVSHRDSQQEKSGCWLHLHRHLSTLQAAPSCSGLPLHGCPHEVAAPVSQLRFSFTMSFQGLRMAQPPGCLTLGRPHKAKCRRMGFFFFHSRGWGSYSCWIGSPLGSGERTHV